VLTLLQVLGQSDLPEFACGDSNREGLLAALRGQRHLRGRDRRCQLLIIFLSCLSPQQHCQKCHVWRRRHSVPLFLSLSFSFFLSLSSSLHVWRPSNKVPLSLYPSLSIYPSLARSLYLSFSKHVG